MGSYRRLLATLFACRVQAVGYLDLRDMAAQAPAPVADGAPPVDVDGEAIDDLLEDANLEGRGQHL